MGERKRNQTVSRSPFKVSYESQVHSLRIVLTLTFEMDMSGQPLEITKNTFPRESIGLLDMVNNSLLERLQQRPQWFQETQFMMQAGLGSLSLGVKFTRGWVFVRTHRVA